MIHKKPTTFIHTNILRNHIDNMKFIINEHLLPYMDDFNEIMILNIKNMLNIQLNQISLT
jgi:hypothetical protein